MSIPPPKNTSLLSNLNSLDLSPNTASKTHPLPLPPVNEIFFTDSISKSCGSIRIFSTDPDKIGSACAWSPVLVSTIIFGGLMIS